MAIVVLPTPLHTRAGGIDSAPVEGVTAGDAGASWFLAAEHLPKVTSVQAS